MTAGFGILMDEYTVSGVAGCKAYGLAVTRLKQQSSALHSMEAQLELQAAEKH